MVISTNKIEDPSTLNQNEVTKTTQRFLKQQLLRPNQRPQRIPEGLVVLFLQLTLDRMKG